MGRHANGSKRRKKREHIALRAEAALTLVRLGSLTRSKPTHDMFGWETRPNAVFEDGEFAYTMGLGGSTSVNWHLHANVALAKLWWEGGLECVHKGAFMLASDDVAENRDRRRDMQLVDLLNASRDWSVMFAQAIGDTCPYPKHPALVIGDEIAEREGRAMVSTRRFRLQ